MKKILSLLLVLLIALSLVACGNKEENSEIIEPDSNTEVNDGGKIAVIYFSATGTTEKVAKIIAKEINATLIEIVPKEEYTKDDLNWNDNKSRTSIECGDETSRPEIANEINVDKYEVIFLGAPVWWGDVPHIMLTFLDTHDLDGKTVIPFCTSGGSNINKSMETYKSHNSNINWIDGGTLNGPTNEIKAWVNGLNY